VNPVDTPENAAPSAMESASSPTAGAPGRVFLTVREAAALLEVSEDTIERACKGGDLPATRLGRQWRIYAAPVHARREGGLDWLLRQHGRLAEIREVHRQVGELHRRLSDLETAYADALTPAGNVDSAPAAGVGRGA
jgi:excisionase family DNA binding protein